MNNIYALVDCNNFYVSCERVFNPGLQDRPVVVLSNNDGIIIARSPEVKALGIPMGAPFFQCQALIKKHGIKVFSSNYTLYGDMSQRVMQVLSGFTPEIEIYSIDEAFLNYKGLPLDTPLAYSQQIRQKVIQWTGIPVSIGIGPTKTLAKVANKIAKKSSKLEGVFDITAHPRLEELLGHVAVDDLWGIGRRQAAMLHNHGIHNALQLRTQDTCWIKKHLTVTGLRLVMELQAKPCHTCATQPQSNQSIVSSRSFGHPVESLEDLREALALYTATAAEKLRRQQLLASVILVFVTTNPFASGPQYSRHLTAKLPEPCDYTPDLLKSAHYLLEKLYQPGYSYKKTGIILLGLVPENRRQLTLYDTEAFKLKHRRLMLNIDALNDRYGTHTVFIGSQGINPYWTMQRNLKSPHYTTRWDDIPRVRCM